MSNIEVLSRTQRIIVSPTTNGLQVLTGGPIGPPGPAGPVNVAVHDTDANYARPAVGANPVAWVGSVDPVNKTVDDIWIDGELSGNGQFVTATPADDAITTRASGDANARFIINTDGKLEFGPATTAPDTNLYRSAANVLGTDDELRIFHPPSGRALGIKQTGDADFRLTCSVSGALAWGNGTSTDTNLYRSAANVLKTDDKFHAVGRLRIEDRAHFGPNEATSAQVRIETPLATRPGLEIKAAVSQTATLTEWQNSAGSVLASVSAVGGVTGATVTANTNNPSLIGAGATGITGTVLAASPSVPGTKGLIVRGAVSQSANLTEWQNSAGTVLARVSPDGRIVFSNALYGDSSGASSYIARFDADAAAVNPLVIRGAAAQTATLTQWENSAGTVLASVGPAGQVAGGSQGVATPTFSYIGDLDTGLTRRGDNYMALVAGGASCLNYQYDTVRKLGFFDATPAAKPAAIASPTADATSLKTAVDAIRSALTTLGLTS